DLPVAVVLADEYGGHLAVEHVDVAIGFEMRGPGGGLVQAIVLDAAVDGPHFQRTRAALHLCRPLVADLRPLRIHLEVRGHTDGVARVPSSTTCMAFILISLSMLSLWVAGPRPSPVAVQSRRVQMGIQSPFN